MNNRKIESIISAYKVLRRQNSDTCVIDCSNAKTLEQAIELAATKDILCIYKDQQLICI